jgi:RNA polymerase sigma factor (sigma-70 family)
MQWLTGERRASPPQATRLYRKVYWRLYAGLGGCATDAKDATQAVFLEVVKNRASIRKGLPEYVSGVGKMKLREHYRRRGRNERTVSRPDLDDLPSSGEDASVAIEATREVARLVHALEQLSIDDQRCLALVYGWELRNVAAAAMLGVSKVVFNNCIGHARKRLRRVLEREEATGAARRRSVQSFPQWVASVLGPPGHADSASAPVCPFGNRFL